MRLAVLASGFGSNLQAIIDAVEGGKITGRVEVVISDQKDAYALERARRHGIGAVYINPRHFSGREAFDREVLTLLQGKNIDLVVLAGYMRLLSPVLVGGFKGKIMNIHPSLLPSFPGLEGVQQALDYGVKVSGCTVHFVDEGLDTGPVILQEAVPVYGQDTAASLQERIHEVEHRLYPRAIQLFIEGKLEIEGRRCFQNET
ncbi:MAG: phosphoribosylglycinamide formyltransferase [Firmicutes bacterium]|jgi:phosphoribosylglycinamide formyltransferase-1|nr:phosphoribosylglycinamide formyltransferase [Bacillota bacterium]